jgi:hypothetical protein
VTNPGDAWIHETASESGTIIGDARRVECPRRHGGRQQAADNKIPAGPARRPVKIWVGIAKPTLNVMRWAAWKRLRSNAAAGNDQEQRNQKCTQARIHKRVQHFRTIAAVKQFLPPSSTARYQSNVSSRIAGNRNDTNRLTPHPSREYRLRSEQCCSLIRYQLCALNSNSAFMRRSLSRSEKQICEQISGQYFGACR